MVRMCGLSFCNDKGASKVFRGPCRGGAEPGDVCKWVASRMGESPETSVREHPRPILDLVDIRHSYPGTVALRGVSLQVQRGEFLTLLGPSGSGKSTLLRVIAGLEEPDFAASMRLDGRDITGVPADKRNVSTVFQHFALFPHMSVGENVEYSLKIRKMPAKERRLRAEEMLALVRLSGKYDRRIHQMSGGERQRVALARSLAMGPDILLLDEPLGALDERLRLDMQLELIELRRKTGATFILVTHSQEEAITMSDRIVLMRAGTIEQIGSPRELFSSPLTMFAARFMGVENILQGRLRSVNGDRVEMDIGETTIVGRGVGEIGAVPAGGKVFAAVRAEHVRLASGAGINQIRGVAGAPIYKGHFCDVTFTTLVGDLVARFGDVDFTVPQEAELHFSPEHCVIGASKEEASSGSTAASINNVH